MKGGVYGALQWSWPWQKKMIQEGSKDSQEAEVHKLFENKIELYQKHIV